MERRDSQIVSEVVNGLVGGERAMLAITKILADYPVADFMAKKGNLTVNETHLLVVNLICSVVSGPLPKVAQVGDFIHTVVDETVSCHSEVEVATVEPKAEADFTLKVLYMDYCKVISEMLVPENSQEDGVIH